MSRSRYINGLWFIDTESPSRYIYRDFPGVSITYSPRVATTRTKLPIKRNPKPNKKPHGGKRIKTKNIKPRYRVTKTLVREWILSDGKTKEAFDTLTDACEKLREVMRDLNAGAIDL